MLYSRGFPGYQAIWKCSANEKQNYFNNLKSKYRNENDINAIKNNKPNSIIILLGDHGPYLTKITVLETLIWIN